MSNVESCKMIQVVWLQLTAAYCVISIIIVCSRYYNTVISEPRGRTDSVSASHALKFAGDTSHVASVHTSVLFGLKYKSRSCPGLFL